MSQQYDIEQSAFVVNRQFPKEGDKDAIMSLTVTSSDGTTNNITLPPNATIGDFKAAFERLAK